MFERELRLPDQLQGYPPPVHSELSHDCVLKTKETRTRSWRAQTAPSQNTTRWPDQEDPPLFTVGNMVWLENKWRKKGNNPKLQPKFVGSYQVQEVYPNHTYRIERRGQTFIQNECYIKPYHSCTAEMGWVPATLEPRMKPNMRGIVQGRHKHPACDHTNPPIDSERSYNLPSKRVHETTKSYLKWIWTPEILTWSTISGKQTER